MAAKGEKNNRWNGGTSQYPNHSLMKRVRKQKLEQVGHKCQICKVPANYIHHLDGSKSNHDPNNLIVVCPSCHFRIFHKVGRPKKVKPPKQYKSKWLREYGVHLHTICRLMGLYPYRVEQLHKAGRLGASKKVIQERTKIIRRRICLICGRRLVDGRCLCGRRQPSVPIQRPQVSVIHQNALA